MKQFRIADDTAYDLDGLLELVDYLKDHLGEELTIQADYIQPKRSKHLDLILRVLKDETQA